MLRYWIGYIESGWNRDSVVGVVKRLRAGQLRNRGLVPDRNISTPNLSELPWGPPRLPKTDIEDSA
jgi:hypothetical protein